MALGFNLGRSASPSWWVNVLKSMCLQLNCSSFWKTFFFLAGASRDEDWKLGEGWQIRMQVHYFEILDMICEKWSLVFYAPIMQAILVLLCKSFICLAQGNVVPFGSVSMGSPWARLVERTASHLLCPG